MKAIIKMIVNGEVFIEEEIEVKTREEALDNFITLLCDKLGIDRE